MSCLLLLLYFWYMLCFTQLHKEEAVGSPLKVFAYGCRYDGGSMLLIELLEEVSSKMAIGVSLSKPSPSPLSQPHLHLPLAACGVIFKPSFLSSSTASTREKPANSKGKATFCTKVKLGSTWPPWDLQPNFLLLNHASSKAPSLLISTPSTITLLEASFPIPQSNRRKVVLSDEIS